MKIKILCCFFKGSKLELTQMFSAHFYVLFGRPEATYDHAEKCWHAYNNIDVPLGEHGGTGQAVEAGGEEGHRQGEVQGGHGLPRQAQEDHRGCKLTQGSKSAQFECCTFVSVPTV
jgi:hypothetical protein